MKLWQKIFALALALFIVAFDIGVLVFVNYSYNYNIEREKENAVREHHIILSNLSNSLSLLETLYDAPSHDTQKLLNIITPISTYYEPGEAFFTLYSDGEIVYSNAPETPEQLKKPDGTAALSTNIDQTQFMFVSSGVQGYSHLIFVYARNINTVIDFKKDIQRLFMIISFVVSGLLGMCLFFFLRLVTKPVTVLNDKAKMIAEGKFSERVMLTSDDEFGELADSFNIMANAVEEKIDQLTRSSEDKEQFINSVSHELKTPVTALIGYTEMLMIALSDEGQRMVAAEHIKNAAERLSGLTEKLYNFIYVGNEAIEPEDVDITKIFDGLSSDFSYKMKEKGVRLILKNTEGSLKGDYTLLYSLFSNLLENALRACESGDTVEVNAEKTDMHIVVKIKDSGLGIESSELEKIQNPFYTIDKARSRDSGGLGLGLSICKRIAQKHGAQILFESEPGKGTTVSVIFSYCSPKYDTPEFTT